MLTLCQRPSVLTACCCALCSECFLLLSVKVIRAPVLNDGPHHWVPATSYHIARVCDKSCSNSSEYTIGLRPCHSQAQEELDVLQGVGSTFEIAEDVRAFMQDDHIFDHMRDKLDDFEGVSLLLWLFFVPSCLSSSPFCLCIC